MTEDGYFESRSTPRHRPEAGEIASIDRGWIPVMGATIVGSLEAGEIASIDRGWILHASE